VVEVCLKPSEDRRKKIWKLPKIPTLSKVFSIVSDNLEDICRTKGTAACLSK